MLSTQSIAEQIVIFRRAAGQYEGKWCPLLFPTVIDQYEVDRPSSQVQQCLQVEKTRFKVQPAGRPRSLLNTVLQENETWALSFFMKWLLLSKFSELTCPPLPCGFPTLRWCRESERGTNYMVFTLHWAPGLRLQLLPMPLNQDFPLKKSRDCLSFLPWLLPPFRESGPKAMAFISPCYTAWRNTCFSAPDPHPKWGTRYDALLSYSKETQASKGKLAYQSLERVTVGTRDW